MKYKRNNNSSSIETTTRVKDKSNPPNGNPAPKKKKHAGGRPLKYNPDLFPNQAYVACSRMGAFHRNLAELFSVTQETIWKWMQDHEEFSYKVRQGIDEWTDNVARKRLRLLIDGSESEEKTVKTYQIGQGRGKDMITLPAIDTTIVTKHILPSLGAIAFWLKSKARNPDGTREFVDYKAVEVGNLDDDKPLKIRVTLESQDEEWE